MTDAGLTVEIDDFGNVLGYKVGKNPDLPVVMVGSSYGQRAQWRQL